METKEDSSCLQTAKTLTLREIRHLRCGPQWTIEIVLIVGSYMAAKEHDFQNKQYFLAMGLATSQSTALMVYITFRQIEGSKECKEI